MVIMIMVDDLIVVNNDNNNVILTTIKDNDVFRKKLVAGKKLWLKNEWKKLIEVKIGSKW